MTAAHSGKCVDAAAAGTADGTAVQQYTCNGSNAQQWQFRAVGGGYVRVDNRNHAAKSWDVTNVSTADAAPVQLWSYSGGFNQQWLPVEEPGGAFHFVNRNSGKCLDIPAASAADNARVQQYTCNGSAAQSFRVGATGVPNPPGTPDLGPNVSVFDPSTPRATIQNKLTRADTVVLGLGLATVIPENGITALNVADVDGVKIAGILIDAGTVNSPTLMQVGQAGASARHTANPTSLHDVFFRIGGAAVGKATQSLVVNSSDVIGDHLWLWRGDHGTGIGWNTNTAATGLVVNGTDVTMYGLFVEHCQQHQVIWNGNGGRTYFFQNEMPYDPPDQAAWMNGSTRGYDAYKVSPSVTRHEAWGLGSYCFFNVNPSVVAERAFEAPNAPGVRFHNMVTVSLGGTGTINRVINNSGGPSNSATDVANLVAYP